MPHQIDLEAYLKRISHQGPRTVDPDTLRALHACHVAAIPFENVDIQLDGSISLQLEAIEEKLVARKRGGYCFEQNGLFAAALETLGFEVTRLMARVLWMAPAEAPKPMTHLILRVDTGDETWLCDVGFGGLGLIRPIRWEVGAVQHTQYESRRLVQQSREVMHQVQLKGQWQDLYAIQDFGVNAADLEVANWYTSAHPNSRFRQALVAARSGPIRRTTLFNNELTHRPHGKDPETKILGSRSELVAALRDSFGIRLSSDQASKLPFRRNQT